MTDREPTAREARIAQDRERFESLWQAIAEAIRALDAEAIARGED